jgi:hypothetical protein
MVSVAAAIKAAEVHFLIIHKLSEEVINIRHRIDSINTYGGRLRRRPRSFIDGCWEMGIF